MRLTIEIDDDEVRRVLGPLLMQTAPDRQAPTKLLTVREVADRLGVSRGKAYELVMRGEIDSLAIGRNRRISPTALAAFISKPKTEPLPVSWPRYTPPRAVRQVVSSQAPAPKQEAHRRQREFREIDLSPRPEASIGPKLTDTEWEEILSGLAEKGWPPDVVDTIREDRRNGLERTYVLAINDAARYLGISRYAVEKLIATGRLRQFTIAPSYRAEKPAHRIPAKDVLALK
jgi:excisionase family DNA binding protein